MKKLLTKSVHQHHSLLVILMALGLSAFFIIKEAQAAAIFPMGGLVVTPPIACLSNPAVPNISINCAVCPPGQQEIVVSSVVNPLIMCIPSPGACIGAGIIGTGYLGWYQLLPHSGTGVPVPTMVPGLCRLL